MKGNVGPRHHRPGDVGRVLHADLLKSFFDRGDFVNADDFAAKVLGLAAAAPPAPAPVTMESLFGGDDPDGPPPSVLSAAPPAKRARAAARETTAAAARPSFGAICGHYVVTAARGDGGAAPRFVDLDPALLSGPEFRAHRDRAEAAAARGEVAAGPVVGFLVLAEVTEADRAEGRASRSFFGMAAWTFEFHESDAAAASAESFEPSLEPARVDAARGEFEFALREDGDSCRPAGKGTLVLRAAGAGVVGGAILDGDYEFAGYRPPDDVFTGGSRGTEVDTVWKGQIRAFKVATETPIPVGRLRAAAAPRPTRPFKGRFSADEDARRGGPRPGERSGARRRRPPGRYLSLLDAFGQPVKQNPRARAEFARVFSYRSESSWRAHVEAYDVKGYKAWQLVSGKPTRWVGFKWQAARATPVLPRRRAP